MNELVKYNETRKAYQWRYFDVEPYVGHFNDSWLTKWNEMIVKLFNDKRVCNFKPIFLGENLIKYETTYIGIQVLRGLI